jgi:hypothetical protein
LQVDAIAIGQLLQHAVYRLSAKGRTANNAQACRVELMHVMGAV